MCKPLRAACSDNIWTYDAAVSSSLYVLSKFLQFLPYIEAVVPRWILNWLAERLPHKGFQRVREVTRTIHERSVEIFNEKKAALQQGDEALKCQIAEGKDIVSLLRKPYPRRLCRNILTDF